jgi:cytochrome P450
MLARLEMRLLFREILTQWKDAASAGEPTKLHSLVLHGINYLPVRVPAA